MARLETKQRAHKKVLIIKPAVDDRFGMSGQIVAKKKKAEKFEPDCSMPARIIKDDDMDRWLIRTKNTSRSRKFV